VRSSRPRLFVALDAGSVSGGAVARGGAGFRLASHARVPLAAGALVPTPFAPNLARPGDVVDALRELARSLGIGTARVCLLLPDGIARLAVLEAPADITPQQYARFRIVPGLPYAPEEAVVDVLSLGGGRTVVAAVRRSVIEGYEAVAEQAGIAQDRLDLTPLAALSGLLRERGGAAGAGLTVDVILGDVAFCLAAHEDGVLRALRNRRRDPGPDEAGRLAEEIERTALLAGNGTGPRVRVVGSGARELIARWRAAGGAAESGWGAGEAGPGIEASELAWLGGAAV
jgi:hypothetical protein